MCHTQSSISLSPMPMMASSIGRCHELEVAHCATRLRRVILFGNYFLLFWDYFFFAFAFAFAAFASATAFAFAFAFAAFACVFAFAFAFAAFASAAFCSFSVFLLLCCIGVFLFLHLFRSSCCLVASCEFLAAFAACVVIFCPKLLFHQ